MCEVLHVRGTTCVRYTLCEVIVFTSVAEFIARYSKLPLSINSPQFSLHSLCTHNFITPVYTVLHIEKCILHAHLISDSSKTRSSSVLPTEVNACKNNMKKVNLL